MIRSKGVQWYECRGYNGTVWGVQWYDVGGTMVRCRGCSGTM